MVPAAASCRCPNARKSAIFPCCASCCSTCSLAEKVAWDVDYCKATSLFRQRLKICLDENLDGLPAGINFDTDRRIAKIYLMSATVLPPNNSVRHSRSPSLPQTPSVGLASVSESEHDCRMIAIALLFVRLLCDCFKSRRRLEAEILVPRHQLNVPGSAYSGCQTSRVVLVRNEVHASRDLLMIRASSCCEHRRQRGSFNHRSNSSHPENLAIACLDFLSLRLHRRWITFATRTP